MTIYGPIDPNRLAADLELLRQVNPELDHMEQVTEVETIEVIRISWR